jgi:hypothetical protein
LLEHRTRKVQREVEALGGGRLPDVAWTDTNWWRKRTSPAVVAWEALGWWAAVDPKRHIVTFRRLSGGA